MIYSICLFAEINSAIGNLQARDSVQHSDPQTIFRYTSNLQKRTSSIGHRWPLDSTLLPHKKRVPRLLGGL